MSYYPAISLLGIFPDKAIIQKNTCTLTFTAALFTIAKTWKQRKCSLTDKGIKIWYIYIPWGLLSLKNYIIPLAATWMDLEIIILSEVSQKDKYHMILFLCEI